MLNIESSAVAVCNSTSRGSHSPAALTRMVATLATVLLSAVAPSCGFIAPPATIPPAAVRPSSFSSFATPTSTPQQLQGIKGRRRSSVLPLVSLRPPVETKVDRGEQVRLAAISTPVSAGAAGVLPPPTKNPAVPSPAKLVYGETAQRSLVKALAWRVTAAVVTLVSSLTFSGSLATAMSIVTSDFLTKSFTMFAGERLWNNVKWGQGQTGDSAKRSLAKATLWRLFAASNTLICGIFLAKDLSVATKIAGSDTVFKTALFFINERAWASVGWGKQYEQGV